MLVIPAPPFRKRIENRRVLSGSPVPPPPPSPAVVVSTGYGPLGMAGWATLTFDRPVTLVAGPVPDDAVTFSAGYVATAVSQQDATTLYFELASQVTTGSAWNVNRQPGWVTTALANPASGSF
jgi:hypothetical protein